MLGISFQYFCMKDKKKKPNNFESYLKPDTEKVQNYFPGKAYLQLKGKD